MSAEIPSPILPPATIGILGGGQLGRMLGYAARAMGYGIRILDPDQACPASVVADHVEVGDYDDLEAALRLAHDCAVVTYELEHVSPGLVDAIEALNVPVRPGARALRVTQDRLAERGFVVAQGVAVAPWREVMVGDDEGLDAALDIVGAPARLKAAFGGYDGRSQVRIATTRDRRMAWMDIGRASGQPAILEREIAFRAELSVVGARGLDGAYEAYPVFRNVHDRGILVSTEWPAGVPQAVDDAAAAIGRTLADAMELVGVLTVELFLLPDGSLVVNELAPRVHNSGHVTLDAAGTSQFEQHIRAICGLPLGATEPLAAAAMVNVLGDGVRRRGQLVGVADALAEGGVHLHLYGKRDVVERRKMGHLTAIAAPDGTTEDALDRAHAALERLSWMA
ncbi:MAG: 5-(carboxyamino)imidazole ribonucleotide synthase [Candidatus Limnocylindrales bacterium]